MNDKPYPELTLVLNLARIGTREQAQDAIRIALRHGATPAQIADAWAGWEKQHDRDVQVLCTDGAA